MTRALITGPTAGIGHAFARALAARGDDLVLVARDRDRLEAIRSDLAGQHGIDIDVIPADLTDPDDLELVEAALASTSKPVDLLINNAGASLAGWFGTTDIADEDRQLDLLVRAPMHLMDVALKTMTGRGHGRIVNVASVAAFTPRGAYSAHKGWLVNLSQWADWQYSSAGVRVMVLCPGFVRTEFHQRGDMDVSGVPGWMWLDAERLVHDALADLDKGRSVSIPSKRYKLLATVARHAPTGLVARVAKRGR